MGAPIEIPLILDPSQADIDKYHDKYVESLELLYKNNVNMYGDKNTKLVVAE